MENNNTTLMLRAERVIPGGVSSNTRRTVPQLMPLRARGAYLTTVEDQVLLDYHAAFGPIILGHCDEKILTDVQSTMESQDLFGVGTTESEIEAAEKIVEHIPSVEKVLFTNSGSEATFHAIRVSRAFTGRTKIIKFQGCYHGWHDYVARNMLSAKDMVGKRDVGSAGMLDEAVDHTLVCKFNDLQDVEKTIEANKNEIAAIIVEPIPHNIGCILPTIEFMHGIRDLANLHGIVLIFDEVITGFRHGLGGYQSVIGVNPDLTTLGKAIANGYPIGAVGGRSEIMDWFSTNPKGPALFAGTYNGHIIGVSAILSTIETLESEPVHEHIFRLGDRLAAGLRELLPRWGFNARIHHFGSVVVPYFMNKGFDGNILSYEDLIYHANMEEELVFRRKMIEQGFFMYPMNFKRNHIMYAHTEKNIDDTLAGAESVLRQMSKEGSY